MKYLYLHGLGQSADSWNGVIRTAEAGAAGNSVCLDLPEMLRGRTASYSSLYAAFSEICDAEKKEIVLCRSRCFSKRALENLIL